MEIAEILKSMEVMEYSELNEVLLAAVKGWSRVHPEEDLVILSLPKGDLEQRRYVLEESRKILMAERFLPSQNR